MEVFEADQVDGQGRARYPERSHPPRVGLAPDRPHLKSATATPPARRRQAAITVGVGETPGEFTQLGSVLGLLFPRTSRNQAQVKAAWPEISSGGGAGARRVDRAERDLDRTRARFARSGSGSSRIVAVVLEDGQAPRPTMPSSDLMRRPRRAAPWSAVGPLRRRGAQEVQWSRLSVLGTGFEGAVPITPSEICSSGHRLLALGGGQLLPSHLKKLVVDPGRGL